MAVILELVDAVVAVLNAGTLGQPVSATRQYQPRFELPELTELHVTVIPKSVTVTQIARNRAAKDYQIDIGVQRKFEAGDAAAIDALMDLTEEIAGLFEFQPLAGYPDAVWIRTEYPTLFAPEHLERLGQFTGVVTLTFRAVR